MLNEIKEYEEYLDHNYENSRLRIDIFSKGNKKGGLKRPMVIIARKRLEEKGFFDTSKENEGKAVASQTIIDEVKDDLRMWCGMPDVSKKNKEKILKKEEFNGLDEKEKEKEWKKTIFDNEIDIRKAAWTERAFDWNIVELRWTRDALERNNSIIENNKDTSEKKETLFSQEKADLLQKIVNDSRIVSSADRDRDWANAIYKDNKKWKTEENLLKAKIRETLLLNYLLKCYLNEFDKSKTISREEIEILKQNVDVRNTESIKNVLIAIYAKEYVEELEENLKQKPEKYSDEFKEFFNKNKEYVNWNDIEGTKTAYFSLVVEEKKPNCLDPENEWKKIRRKMVGKIYKKELKRGSEEISVDDRISEKYLYKKIDKAVNEEWKEIISKRNKARENNRRELINNQDLRNKWIEEYKNKLSNNGTKPLTSWLDGFYKAAEIKEIYNKELTGVLNELSIAYLHNEKFWDLRKELDSKTRIEKRIDILKNLKEELKKWCSNEENTFCSDKFLFYYGDVEKEYYKDGLRGLLENLKTYISRYEATPIGEWTTEEEKKEKIRQHEAEVEEKLEKWCDFNKYEEIEFDENSENEKKDEEEKFIERIYKDTSKKIIDNINKDIIELDIIGKKYSAQSSKRNEVLSVQMLSVEEKKKVDEIIKKYFDENIIADNITRKKKEKNKEKTHRQIVEEEIKNYLSIERKDTFLLISNRDSKGIKEKIDSLNEIPTDKKGEKERVFFSDTLALKSDVEFETLAKELKEYKAEKINVGIEEILLKMINSSKEDPITSHVLISWEEFVLKNDFNKTLFSELNELNYGFNDNINTYHKITFERVIAEAVALGKLKEYVLVYEDNIPENEKELRDKKLKKNTNNGIKEIKEKADERECVRKLVVAYLIAKKRAEEHTIGGKTFESHYNIVNMTDLANWTQKTPIFKGEYFSKIIYDGKPLYWKDGRYGVGGAFQNITKIHLNDQLLEDYGFAILEKTDNMSKKSYYIDLGHEERLIYKNECKSQ